MDIIKKYKFILIRVILLVCVTLFIGMLMYLYIIKRDAPNMNINKPKLNVQYMKVIKMEYSDKGDPLNMEYSISDKDIEAFLEILDYEHLDFTSDILKLEPERAYVIEVNSYQKFYINRDKLQNGKLYLDFISSETDNMVWLGAYVNPSFGEKLDTLLSNYQK